MRAVIERPRYLQTIEDRLKSYPVVALLGPRQVGKTTLARKIAGRRSSSTFLDLESPATLRRLAEPNAALEPLSGLIVIDEIQRQPDLFPILRVLADRKPLPARFLILGSASPQMVQGVSESLAGRVSFVDVGGFDLSEVDAGAVRKLWWRGGFPLAFLAKDNAACRQWHADFIRTLLERDMPQLGVTIPAAIILRFWTMVAHFHGQVWNAAELARSLGSGESTARRYLDILTSMFLVRQLQPWFANIGKRQVKAPKVYVRDPGLLHSLLHIDSPENLESHPKLGSSWEGFALEQVLRFTGDLDAYFWATHSGAELDLLVHWRGKRWGFEFKYSDGPVMTKSMHIALADLQLERIFAVYPGKDSYALHERAEALPIRELDKRLNSLGRMERKSRTRRRQGRREG